MRTPTAQPAAAGTVTAVNSAGFVAPAGLTAVSVVFAPLEGRLQVLLVRRADEPQRGRWNLPGGFMSPGERPEQTAQRKLTEKTGVGAVYLEQLQTYADPARDPRGWIPTMAYLALINAAVLDGSEPPARWVPVDELPPLAFDHAAIVGDGVARLRGKLWWSNIAVGLLPERFTMPQARAIFEAISGHRYEPSNFRRELEHSGLIRDTGVNARGGPGRPAALYEFVERHPAWSLRRSRPPATLSTRSRPVTGASTRSDSHATASAGSDPHATAPAGSGPAAAASARPGLTGSVSTSPRASATVSTRSRSRRQR